MLPALDPELALNTVDTPDTLQNGSSVMITSITETQTAPQPSTRTVELMELWAFLENSDFTRHDGYVMDEVALIRHVEFLVVDYQLMVDIGLKGVRDAARWLLTNPAPGVYDWTWMDRIVAAAEKSNLDLHLDLWHYGYPEWMDILSPEAPEQFANFARAIALRYPTLTYYCVCN